MSSLQAVCFDVDYTLLRPGHCFDASGYLATGSRHGLVMHPGRWHEAEQAAWNAVRRRRDEMGDRHDPLLIDAVARAVLRTLSDGSMTRHEDEATADSGQMAALDAAVDEVAGRWLDLRNFALYDDVVPCLQNVRERGLRVCLISNTDRDLDQLVVHFGLDGQVDATVASREVGLFKPAAGVFAAALARVAAPAAEAVMVGDSLHDDIGGAMACGFAAAVHLDRAGTRPRRHEPTIRSLAELPALLDSLLQEMARH